MNLFRVNLGTGNGMASGSWQLGKGILMPESGAKGASMAPESGYQQPQLSRVTAPARVARSSMGHGSTGSAMVKEYSSALVKGSMATGRKGCLNTSISAGTKLAEWAVHPECLASVLRRPERHKRRTLSTTYYQAAHQGFLARASL